MKKFKKIVSTVCILLLILSMINIGFANISYAGEIVSADPIYTGGNCMGGCNSISSCVVYFLLCNGIWMDPTWPSVVW